MMRRAMVTLRAGIGVFALVLAALVTPVASAAPVVWQMSGTIERIGVSTGADFTETRRAEFLADWQSRGIAVGAHWTSTLTFDSAAGASVIPPSRVSFTNPSISLSFTVGELTATSAPSFLDPSADLYLGTIYGDWLLFSSRNVTSSLTGPQLFQASLGLVASVGELFPLDALPVNPPDLALLVPPLVDVGGATVGTHFGLSGLQYVPGVSFPAIFSVAGRLTQLQRVPEPPGWELLACAVLASGARKSRQRNRR
jgi:hypothetical protein